MAQLVSVKSKIFAHGTVLPIHFSPTQMIFLWMELCGRCRCQVSSCFSIFYKATCLFLSKPSILCYQLYINCNIWLQKYNSIFVTWKSIHIQCINTWCVCDYTLPMQWHHTVVVWGACYYGNYLYAEAVLVKVDWLMGAVGPNRKLI